MLIPTSLVFKFLLLISHMYLMHTCTSLMLICAYNINTIHSGTLVNVIQFYIPYLYAENIKFDSWQFFLKLIRQPPDFCFKSQLLSSYIVALVKPWLLF